MIELAPSLALTAGLERYRWTLNLLQPLAELRRHALADARALEAGGGEPPPAEVHLNLLLTVCAAEQVTADHLVRGGLDLGPLAAAAPAAARRPAAWLEAAFAAGCSLRSLTSDREAVALLAGLRALALALATSLAAGGAPPSEAEVEAAFFEPRDPVLLARPLKVPACFRAEDLGPADCFELARRFAGGARPGASILVVGARTSGSYMAPLCAGRLAADGFAAGYTTIRPKAPFVRAERHLLAEVPDHVLVVDDPPMTGSAFARSAARLEAAGVPRDRIVFLVPGSAERDPARVAAAFDGYRVVELPHEELELRRRLDSPELAAWLAAAAGRPGAPARPLWPAARVEVEARRRHLRQLYEVEGAGTVLAKGVGTGWFAYPARFAAGALEGWTPEVLGFQTGLMASRWLAGGAGAPSLSRLAAYTAARAVRLRIERPPVSRPGFQKDGFYRLGKLLARVYGPLAPLRLAAVRKLLLASLPAGPAGLLDGRLGLEEWLAGEGAALKCDFEEHAFDKDDLGFFDPAIDLGGALLESGPSREARAFLAEAYASSSGDSGAARRLPLASLLYGAFRFERLGWEVSGELGSPGWDAAVRRFLEAESALSWCLDSLLADGFGLVPGSGPRRGEGAWSLDVDGVLEDAGLGFPSATPAAARALSLMRGAGAAVVLNTGRSVDEVALRCDALGLDGGVGEYGGAVWHPGLPGPESLVDRAGREGLERVRLRARDLEGIHVDARYRHSVRLRRFARGRLRALREPEIALLLEAGGPAVRVVPGGAQTDFAAAGCDKGRGLARLLELLGVEGQVRAMGDSAADLPMCRAAGRAYAPRYHDPVLDGAARVLRSDRQAALLEAAAREHPEVAARTPRRRPAGAADAPLVELLAVRDLPRARRALKAAGRHALEVFRT